MAEAVAIIDLSERLRRHAGKARNHETIADLWLASRYLGALAASGIADQAEAEIDPRRKARLERKFIEFYCRILC